MRNSIHPSQWRRLRSAFAKIVEDPSASGRMQRIAEIGPTPSMQENLVGLLNNYRSEDPLFDWAGISAGNAGAAPLFQEGQVLSSRFRVVRFLGRGGMGEVYEAQDTTLSNRPVAIKTLSAEIRYRPEAARRFFREVELAQRVTHPNICRIHDIYHHSFLDPVTGAEHQTHFLAMQLLRGETLAEYLAKRERLPISEALELLRQLAGALEAAHSAGVIHRDFKPGNVILVDRQGALRPVITDFGLASLIDLTQEGDGDQKLAGYTRAGTPEYAPTEQIEGGRVTAAADTFALGVVALELLTGQTRDRSPKDLTGTQRSALERCLSEDPAARFSSPSEFVHALAGDRVLFQDSNRILTRRGLVIGAVSAAGATALTILARNEFPSGSGISTLSILPFDGDTGLAAMPGFREELIRVFLKSRKLRLIAPYSTASLKPPFDFQKIARLLQADGFLTGVISSSDVLVKLIRKSGSLLWQKHFPRTSTDFTLHREIQAAVLSEVDAGEVRSLTKSSYAPSRDGYMAYVNGRSALTRHNADDLIKAEALFQEAIHHDAGFAPAWAGLAYTRLIANRLPAARSAADQAIALDGQSAEAYLVKGLVLQRADWKWDDAERAFQQALGYEPYNGRAHQWYGGLLSDLGRAERARGELEMAVELDPISFNSQITLGICLVHARQFDEAIGHLEKGIAMARESGCETARPYPFLGACWLMKGDREKAFQYYLQAARMETRSPVIQSHFVFGAARCGRLAEAKNAFDQLLELPDAQVHPFYLALAFLGMGDRKRAFDYLNLAIENRDSDVVLLKTHLYLDSLRPDPLYKSIVEKLGL
jgi:serine/threonine protein kinase/tetratricopeptide (TPR) repeat protein